MARTLSVETTLESAHKLECMPEGHKCKNLHGHTFSVAVHLATNDEQHDLIIDSGLVKAQLERFDHCYLNDKFRELGYGHWQPSVERIAQVLWLESRKMIPAGVTVSSVWVREGFGALSVYSGG